MEPEQIQERVDKLADRLNEFRTQYNRYPTHGDFRERRITPSRAIFYKVFNGMGEATKYAEELWIKERFRLKKKRIRKFSGKKQEGIICPCCGRAWEGNLHSALREAIKKRLLYIENSESYQTAVLRLMVFLFGTQAVKDLGYDVEKIENNHTCFCGEKFKPKWHSSFKVIVTGRLLDLIQSVNGKSPSEAATDCGEAIFGKNRELH